MSSFAAIRESEMQKFREQMQQIRSQVDAEMQKAETNIQAFYQSQKIRESHIEIQKVNHQETGVLISKLVRKIRRLERLMDPQADSSQFTSFNPKLVEYLRQFEIDSIAYADSYPNKHPCPIPIIYCQLNESELDEKMPDPCPICYENYTKEFSATTSCQHVFCQACIDGLLHFVQEFHCPYCRTLCENVTNYRRIRVPK